MRVIFTIAHYMHYTFVTIQNKGLLIVISLFYSDLLEAV